MGRIASPLGDAFTSDSTRAGRSSSPHFEKNVDVGKVDAKILGSPPKRKANKELKGKPHKRANLRVSTTTPNEFAYSQLHAPTHYESSDKLKFEPLVKRTSSYKKNSLSITIPPPPKFKFVNTELHAPRADSAALLFPPMTTLKDPVEEIVDDTVLTVEEINTLESIMPDKPPFPEEWYNAMTAASIRHDIFQDEDPAKVLQWRLTQGKYAPDSIADQRLFRKFGSMETNARHIEKYHLRHKDMFSAKFPHPQIMDDFSDPDESNESNESNEEEWFEANIDKEPDLDDLDDIDDIDAIDLDDQKMKDFILLHAAKKEPRFCAKAWD